MGMCAHICLCMPKHAACTDSSSLNDRPEGMFDPKRNVRSILTLHHLCDSLRACHTMSASNAVRVHEGVSGCSSYWLQSFHLVPGAFQEGKRALDTWRSTVESVHSDVGYAPAMAMLSAYGFYNGQTRSDPGGGPAARTGFQHSVMLACALTRDIFGEVSCCITPAMLHEGKISNF